MHAAICGDACTLNTLLSAVYGCRAHLSRSILSPRDSLAQQLAGVLRARRAARVGWQPRVYTCREVCRELTGLPKAREERVQMSSYT